jgi:hypothetical protein
LQSNELEIEEIIDELWFWIENDEDEPQREQDTLKI